MFFIVCFSFMLLYYGICIYALYTSRTIKYLKNQSNKDWLIIVLLLIIGTLGVFIKIKENQFIYYWDYGGYWTMAVQQVENMIRDPLGSAYSVYLSIRFDDYNRFLPTVIAMPLKIFGSEFEQYVLINHVFFLIPTVIIQSLSVLVLLSKNLANKIDYKKPVVLYESVIYVLLFPANYYAMLRGYIDVAVLLPVSILLLLLLVFDIRKKDIKKDIAIALLLVLVMISRRYYAYFVLGYVVVLILKLLVTSVQKEDKYFFLKEGIVNLFYIGIISIGILIVFFREMFLRSIFTNYAEMYVAYNAGLLVKLKLLMQSFGYVGIVFLLISGIICFFLKTNRLNYSLMIIMVLVEVIFFFRVQVLDIHHRYIISTQIMLLQSFIFSREISDFANIFKRYNLLIIFFACIYIFNFSSVYMGVPKNNYNIFAHEYTPLKREDIKTLNEIKEYLNSLTLDNEKKIYVAASGSVLNNDILFSLDKPYNFEPIKGLQRTNDIDLRDGFPTQFLSSEIVVTTFPIQLHTTEGTQEVIRFLAQEVMDSDSPVGRHYHFDKEFILDGGVKALIYIKDTHFEEGDINFLKSYFSRRYPNHKELFEQRIH